MYLKIEQLSKSYGARPVVCELDLSMEEGEILSLLGPSGCGKTTILRMLAGLVKPNSGHIEVGGRIFYDGKRELPVEERWIGMVFQDYVLWPHMTVAQNELYLRPINTFVGSFMGPANLLAGHLANKNVGSGMASLQLDESTFAGQQVLGVLSQELNQSQEQQPLHLLCRPEDICIHTEYVAGEQLNVFPATVTFSSFVDRRWRTLVEVGQEQKQSLLAFPATSLIVQTPVWVELPPERCLIVAQ